MLTALLLVLLTTGPVSAPEPVEDVWHVEAATVEAPADPAPTPRAPSADPAPEPPAPRVNLDALAYAVAVAETGNCTTGMGVTKNNCHGIMTWATGKRSGRVFASTDDSFAAFKEMWPRIYGEKFPTLADAIKYTGNDKAPGWLADVRVAYDRFLSL